MKLRLVPPLTEKDLAGASRRELDSLRARIRQSVEDRGRGFSFRRGRLRIIIRLLPKE